MIGREMDGALAAHLLERKSRSRQKFISTSLGVSNHHPLAVYQALPQSWLPLGIRGRLQQQFEAVGRRLDALEPQTEASPA